MPIQSEFRDVFIFLGQLIGIVKKIYFPTHLCGYYISVIGWKFQTPPWHHIHDIVEVKIW